MKEKTKVNIGTSKGNIQGAEFDKPFNDINLSDIREVVDTHDGFESCAIQGWAHVTD